MRTLRCKCGARQMWTSMGSQDCQGCPDCNTTYAAHPDNHRELKPHTMITRYNQNTGKPYQMCKLCSHLDKDSYKKAQTKDKQ